MAVSHTKGRGAFESNHVLGSLASGASKRGDQRERGRIFWREQKELQGPKRTRLGAPNHGMDGDRRRSWRLRQPSFTSLDDGAPSSVRLQAMVVLVSIIESLPRPQYRSVCLGLGGSLVRILRCVCAVRMDEVTVLRAERMLHEEKMCRHAQLQRRAYDRQKDLHGALARIAAAGQAHGSHQDLCRNP